MDTGAIPTNSKPELPKQNNLANEIATIKAQAEVELNKIKAESSAKEVAGKAIGEGGLFYITLIIAIGVGASVVLDNDKIAAVMGLLGAALTALISMLNGIAGTAPKQEKPEFEVIKNLIDKLDRLNVQEPMQVKVEGDKVTVTKGADTITTKKD
jgi:flagellar biosynthesis/type III secretory pathway ATPase